MRVIPGGAAQGTEIAGLQFTNAATSSCTLVGWPRVVLLRYHHVIGTPSQPTQSGYGHLVQLQPGQTTQSLLRDYSTCQAPLSDAARVRVPGSTARVVRPAELRACTLRVGPLGKPR